MLCNNDSCVNHQCKIKYSGAIKLAEISGQRRKVPTVIADFKSDSCGFRLFGSDKNGIQNRGDATTRD